MVVLLDQSTKDVYIAYSFLILFLVTIFIMVRQHLDERVSSLSGYYIKEKRGAEHRNDGRLLICSAPPRGSAHLSVHPSRHRQIAFAKLVIILHKTKKKKEKVSKYRPSEESGGEDYFYELLAVSKC